MKMEQCSETSAYKIQTPGSYPEESIQQSHTNWSQYIMRQCAVQSIRRR